MAENNEDFELSIVNEDKDTDTVVVTSCSDISDKWLVSALNAYDPSNQPYSAYLKDGNSPSQKITPEYLDELAENAQNDITKIQTINSIIRKQINKNDIVGKTVECIDTNINTQIKLSYNAEIQDDQSPLDEVKNCISVFNEMIHIKKLTRNSISTAFAEGNYFMYLRHSNNHYKVDYYPLGVVEVAEWDKDGEPILLFNVQELRNRLQKVYKKTRKNKYLFFESMEEEVKENYPEEVYNAFIVKEKYAKLDTKYSGVIRINNLNRRYGVSPIFRSLDSLSMLDTFNNSDRVNSKAKAKKIIHQKLRREVLGQEFNKQGFEEMAYAHQNFMSAWKQPTVVVTTPPTVESINYVEPKIELTDINSINNYRSRVLSTLGIGFLMDSSSQSVSTASISVTQLMRTINTISEQLEEVLKKWYRQVLSDNGLDVRLCPDIEIIDSEALDFSLRKELATTLYTIFNGSLETSLKILGVDINDETAKRTKENNLSLDTEVFYPRCTSFTSSGKETNFDEGKSKPGRPKNKTKSSKTEYDDTYNQNAR